MPIKPFHLDKCLEEAKNIQDVYDCYNFLPNLPIQENLKTPSEVLDTLHSLSQATKEQDASILQKAANRFVEAQYFLTNNNVFISMAPQVIDLNFPDKEELDDQFPDSSIIENEDFAYPEKVNPMREGAENTPFININQSVSCDSSPCGFAEEVSLELGFDVSKAEKISLYNNQVSVEWTEDIDDEDSCTMFTDIDINGVVDEYSRSSNESGQDSYNVDAVDSSLPAPLDPSRVARARELILKNIEK